MAKTPHVSEPTSCFVGTCQAHSRLRTVPSALSLLLLDICMARCSPPGLFLLYHLCLLIKIPPNNPLVLVTTPFPAPSFSDLSYPAVYFLSMVLNTMYYDFNKSTLSALLRIT